MQTCQWQTDFTVNNTLDSSIPSCYFIRTDGMYSKGRQRLKDFNLDFKIKWQETNIPKKL